MHTRLFSVVRTLLVSFLIGFLLLCFLALLMWKLQLSVEHFRAGLYVSYVLSCLFGGYCLGHIFPKGRVLWGIGFGLGYFLFLLLLSVTAAGHTLLFTPGAFLILLLCCFSGACGAFFS